MDQQDIDRELADAREVLDATSSAHLAYTAKDGTPRTVPVGYFWTGEQFVIATHPTAPKVAALTARPDVALAFDVGDSPQGARSLSVRGRAEIRVVDGVAEEYLAAARANMDAEAFAQFEQACRAMYDQMARISITPGWARYYDFGAGRFPTFLRELAERSGQ
ncbi:pyridoxamine 5'-phosphate oxidase family protein [Isoptericola hypogeus]|uniref:Pyridoxamine 5'-phosphate oxidase family protein n=1 Tax=Isoptericola hypogeus TaxID=300179 RepID=A0ABP4UQR5_9MICO